MATHAPLDIRIKRIYEHAHEGDGTRVLVDRLWPRGLSKDAAELSLWLKDIAPSAELRTWFGHDPERYAEFSTRYRAELAGNLEAVAQLEELARQGPLTLLYGAHDEEHNQARVLAEYLREHLKRKRTGG
jgi:uncharacterized protein YeaO (DUF488 family)